MKTINHLTIKFLGSIGIAMFLFTSCSPSAHIEKDKSVNFKNYKTYTWLDSDGSGKNDRNRNNDLEEKKVREAVNLELKKQGLTEVKSSPGVFLSYDVLVENTSKKQRDPVYSEPYTRTYYNPYTRRWVNVYYPSRFLGYDNYEVPVKERTITITMIDGKTDKTVWQGWTTVEARSRNLTGKEIESSVRAIFKKSDLAKK